MHVHVSILMLMIFALPALLHAQEGKSFGYMHDFGRIVQGKPVNYTFQIANRGQSAIRVSDVRVSCGCTTPEWTKEVILPGKTAEIKVGYNAQAEGPFEKNITLIYDNGEVTELLIRGHVWTLTEPIVPVNRSLSILKRIN